MHDYLIPFKRALHMTIQRLYCVAHIPVQSIVCMGIIKFNIEISYVTRLLVSLNSNNYVLFYVRTASLEILIETFSGHGHHDLFEL